MPVSHGQGRVISSAFGVGSPSRCGDSLPSFSLSFLNFKRGGSKRKVAPEAPQGWPVLLSPVVDALYCPRPREGGRTKGEKRKGCTCV